MKFCSQKSKEKAQQ